MVVIRNPTNLYPQEMAPTPSMDHAFALHIGVTARVIARKHIEAPVDGPPRELVSSAWRKFEQAAKALDKEDEAEDFQAVGMRLRECLISFVQETAGAATVPEGSESPKRADFKGWASLLAEAVSPGSGGAQMRSYLRALSRERGGGPAPGLLGYEGQPGNQGGGGGPAPGLLGYEGQPGNQGGP